MSMAFGAGVYGCGCPAPDAEPVPQRSTRGAGGVSKPEDAGTQEAAGWATGVCGALGALGADAGLLATIACRSSLLKWYSFASPRALLAP
jgi:hypothetical protein